MKAQLNLFSNGLTGTDNSSAILDKAVLKERIKNTHFQSAHPSFIIVKWEAGDELLPMYYTIEETPLGEVLIAATSKGITYLGFIVKDETKAIADVKKRFPESNLMAGSTDWHIAAINRIENPETEQPLHLHLKGTEYQLSIWEKLLLIPFGGVTNYKMLGDGNPDSREIGAAVGANPVGYLIPCHRVIRADGNFYGFFWGNKVKAHLLTYEAVCAVN
ncbi:methylated-DNA--[protein]-cysteine S-methyltransferase [Mucilaginibacter sabulilitoris]|uniref:Methylated-DNA--[protein]-cysteine S-methyltransferase n=1 Tax=Mucilaginibacter sabulilitoris TaxID=1173583 RepID=A0ABZ0TSB9_9SPHI|nr:methylated-DNA--[protein]-cysteine S-methyltransferase [Mucilaginibacter sabulilitoris]WPU95048.1 methylated-DNA--[protein]-cysteine S-methyltransferase [Mucilaginibacter sabulilitoris]